MKLLDRPGTDLFALIVVRQEEAEQLLKQGLQVITDHSLAARDTPHHQGIPWIGRMPNSNGRTAL